MTATRKAATLLALAALWVAAAALLWRTRVPPDLAVAELDARDEFGAERLRETARYTRVVRALSIAGTLAQVAALAVLAARGPALAGRVRGGYVARGVLLLLLVLASAWLARLPFRLAAHWWRRRHGLSRQPYADWLVSPWLELLASALVACVALALAMLLARRLGPKWWIAGAPIVAALGAASVLAQPLVLAPRLEPLADRRLAAEIHALARRAGVGRVGVDVKDASERTTTLNAEIAGIGPTRRVVLWDTLPRRRVPTREVRFLAAHELAHVRRFHLWKGLAWFALLALPGTYAVAAVTRRRGGLAEPGAVPLAALAVVVLQLALLPLVNAISRRYEAEADWVALEATRDPLAAEGLLRRFSAVNLTHPDPPRWAYAILATHPSLLERIALSRAWGERPVSPTSLPP